MLRVYEYLTCSLYCGYDVYSIIYLNRHFLYNRQILYTSMYCIIIAGSPVNTTSKLEISKLEILGRCHFKSSHAKIPVVETKI